MERFEFTYIVCKRFTFPITIIIWANIAFVTKGSIGSLSEKGNISLDYEMRKKIVISRIEEHSLDLFHV